MLALLLIAALTVRAELTVTSLKIDYKTNPLGIDNPRPRAELDHSIRSDEYHAGHYEIRAALSVKDVTRGRDLLWETGKVSFLPKYSCGIWWSPAEILSAHFLAGKNQ